MGLFDSLFSEKSSSQPADQASSSDHTSTDGKRRKPPGLLVVFENPGAFRGDTLQHTLTALSPAFQNVSVQTLPGTFEQGTPVLRISWTQHVIDIVAMDVPLPKQPLENCVQPAHYSQEIKAKARAHRAHAVLFYSGDATSALEQYVALAAVAAAFAKHGAIAVLNESAMTSLPASTVYQLATKQPNFEMLRHLPLLMLYCGFVKYFLSDNRTAWMRTYNNPAFGLPDFAAKAALDQAQSMFNQFSDLMSYLASSGKKFAPGHTAEVGEAKLRFRAPRDDEPFPTYTEGQLLIAEITK